MEEVKVLAVASLSVAITLGAVLFYIFEKM